MATPIKPEHDRNSTVTNKERLEAQTEATAKRLALPNHGYASAIFSNKTPAGMAWVNDAYEKGFELNQVLAAGKNGVQYIVYKESGVAED